MKILFKISPFINFEEQSTPFFNQKIKPKNNGFYIETTNSKKISIFEKKNGINGKSF
jgi:hypothetical protein